MSTPPLLDAIAKSLNSYSGRDKAARSLAFIIQLHAWRGTREAPVKEWISLAKQLSAARLVFRRLNHPSALKECSKLASSASEDFIDRSYAWTMAFANAAHGFVELAAWLSDAKLIAGDAAKLFRWCLYLWLTARAAGVIRQSRLMAREGRPRGKVREDALLLLCYACDFIAGATGLPKGVLWSGSMHPKTTAKLSLVASLISFYRTF